MEKTDIDIKTLVGKIKSNEIVLPEIQRRFVWTSTKVRDLMDSLYRKYPTGAILVWEKDRGELPSRDIEVGIEKQKSPYSANLMLLDGQQRLTALAALIEGKPVKIKNRKQPIEIMFNLEHPNNFISEEETDDTDEDSEDEEEMEQDDEEENAVDLRDFTFVVASKRLKKEKLWVKVTDIFTKTESTILKERGLNSDDENWDKYTNRIKKVQAIKDYSYVMNTLEKEYSYDEVTEIFVRVNSAGARLRSSDLALAQITSKWKGCLDIFQKFLDEQKEDGFDIDMNNLIRTLIVYATKQCKFQAADKLLKNDIESAWEQTKTGLDYALNFLRENTLVEDLGLLASPFIIVPICFYSSEKKGILIPNEVKDLIKWVYLANIFGNYSGSSETTLNSELNILKNNGNMRELINSIERRKGRLKIDEKDLKGKLRSSSLFAMSYMVMKDNNAKDWVTGMGISKGAKGKFHAMQCHHIFPKAILKTKYSYSEVNEIANLSFISGKANRRIAAQEPKIYFEKIIEDRGEEVLIDQFIPMDKNLWKTENYRDFLLARRLLLADAINKLLK